MTPDERTRLLAESRARKKAAREPMVPVKVPLAKELGAMVGSFGRFVRRQAEDAGVSTEEIERRIARMQEWATFCLTNPNQAAQEAKSAELFGPESVAEPVLPGVLCQKCNDAGMYRDRNVSSRSRVHKGLALVAMVTCSCDVGKRKAEAAAGMGWKKRPARRNRKDEDASLWED